MKKYLCLAAAGLFLLSACSNDEGPINNGGGSDNGPEQTIVLKVASSGDNFVETRAGRPLYSSEALQTIDKVKIVIYADNGQGSTEIKAVKTIDDWSTDPVSDVYKTGGHGRKASWTLKGEDKLTAGTYKVIAVGYNETSDYTTFAFKDITNKQGTLTLPLSASLAGTGTAAEEIFAGEITSLTVGADGAFDLTTNGTANELTLHRQVSGTFGYFTGIPAKGATGTEEATTLRLVSSNLNTKLFMNNFNSSFTETGANVQYVVNGTTASTAAKVKFADGVTDGYSVYSITLSDWFTQGDDKNAKGNGADGILDKYDTWTSGIAAVNGIPDFAAGSVFGGNFLIPFTASTTANTFELQLLDKNNVVLRSWNIKLASDDAQYTKDANTNKVSVASDAGEYSANGVAEALDKYSIVRNHLYTIGKRSLDDPENPGTDPDKPQDLSKDQDIIIKVNDNWEAIHQLVVD